jgi:predicted XRE-type DNA-binding protein
MATKKEYSISSGNVYKDTGMPDPDTALAKAKLVLQIDKIIEEKGLTQKEAAKILGTTQSKVSTLLRGRLSSFTFDLLFAYLKKLNQNIEISTKTVENKMSPSVFVAEDRPSA